MKKRKLTAILLTAVIIAVCLTPFASAAVKDKPLYISIGDSITYGTMLEGGMPYNAIAAEAWGADLIDLSVVGLTSQELIDILNAYKSGNGAVIDDISNGTLSLSSWSAIENADVITLTVGSADLLFNFLKELADILGIVEYPPKDARDTNALFDAALDKLDSFDMLDVVQKLVKKIQTQAYKNELKSIISEVEERWPVIVDLIKEINPEAALIVTNAYNPMVGFDLDSLTGGRVDFDIEKFANTYITLLNRVYSGDYEARGGKAYKLVDVAGRFTGRGLTNFTGSKLDPHPTAEGHDAYAKAILHAVPEVEIVHAENVLPPADEVWTNPYKDVDEDDWFYSGVKFSDEKGLVDPKSDFIFDTETLITRSALVAALGRLAGVASDYDEINESQFSDVPVDYKYKAYISWANDHEIVTGFSDGTFRPDELVTREQMCAIITRFAAFMDITLTADAKGVDAEDMDETMSADQFADSGLISSWAREYVSACFDAGLVQGKATGFDPAGGTKRSEAVVILLRLYENFMA